MAAGLDTSRNCRYIATDIKNRGYSFVCRYYNTNDPSKNLTLPEAQALSKAGLYIVSVWENGFPTSAYYFSPARGENDAAAAYNYAKHTIGQPTGTPIYFAVDYDASYSDYSGPVLRYFQAIEEKFSELGGEYSIGVYGSGDVCRFIYNNVGAVHFTWLAMSTGWSGYNNFTSWNLKQGGTTTISGVPFDKDISNGNGGGFRVSY